MAFTLGLAGVYMSERVPNEVSVDPPTAESTNIFSVFTDVPPTLRPDRNCGKDPLDAQARIDCANERLFGKRDMSRYASYAIICDGTTSDTGLLCDRHQFRRKRELVWRHWTEKTRAHISVTYFRKDYNREYTNESHYFIEPYDSNSWHLVSQHKSFKIFLIDGRETEVGMVDDGDYPYFGPWSYKHARWKTATADDYRTYVEPGRRYLEFENETGDTVTF
jgi:hypothetical protein